MVKKMNSFDVTQHDKTDKGGLFKSFYDSGRINGCIMYENEHSCPDECIVSKTFVYTPDLGKPSEETIVILFDSRESDEDFTAAVKETYGSAENFLEAEQIVIRQKLKHTFPLLFALKYSIPADR